VTRNSKSLSSIQRAAGGEMAAARLMSEWACEVVITNPRFRVIVFLKQIIMDYDIRII